MFVYGRRRRRRVGGGEAGRGGEEGGGGEGEGDVRKGKKVDTVFGDYLLLFCSKSLVVI